MLKNAAYHRNGVLGRGSGVSGAVRQEQAVRAGRQNAFPVRLRGKYRDFATDGSQASQDVLLGAVIHGGDLVFRLHGFRLAARPSPTRLAPLVLLKD